VGFRLLVFSDAARTVEVFRSAALTIPAHGYVIAQATGLLAGTTYYYGWEDNGTLLPTGRGKFKTAPAVSVAASFAFAAASCADTNSNHAIYTHIRDQLPLFLLHAGDYDYSNENTTIEANHRAARETALNQSNQAALKADVSMVYTWSDHDFCGNNSDSTSAGRDAARAVYRQLFPAHDTMPASGPIHRTFQIGRVHFFVMDTRSESSPSINTDNATKTKLGATQKQAYKNWLLANKTSAKVVVSAEPWHAAVVAGEDDWGGYSTERTEIVNYMSANGITNVAIISGDMHACAFESGDTSPGGIPVCQAAPFDRPASLKGGPYDKGPIPASGGAQTNQYGFFTVTDTGGANITMVFSARNSTGATVFTDSTITFANVAAVAAAVSEYVGAVFI
jgi:phosphodiesterase/alkaline phosphatase D-like protein